MEGVEMNPLALAAPTCAQCWGLGVTLPKAAICPCVYRRLNAILPELPTRGRTVWRWPCWSMPFEERRIDTAWFLSRGPVNKARAGTTTKRRYT